MKKRISKKQKRKTFKKKRIDLRGKKERNWNPFFKNLAQIERRNPPQ